MAKKRGVNGWHAMRKEQLIRALVQAARKKGKPIAAASVAPACRSKPMVARDKGGAATSPRVLQKIREEHQRETLFRDLSATPVVPRRAPSKDRVVLLVRDPYWLHVYWEIAPSTIDRARISLGERWHEATPTLRIMAATDDSTGGTVEQVYRDVPIHGGVSNWYVDVDRPPMTFRAMLGYRMADDRFHKIAKSNTVTTPIPNTQEAFDSHWADVAKDYERIYSLSGGGRESVEADLREVFEEKLRRPMATPVFARFGGGMNSTDDDFHFGVDAEMIIYGTTDPKASVTMAGEPVKLRSDGSFAVSMAIPDRRQVIPVVASSRDGSKQRTTVLAIERNTKVMEPVNCETDEL